MIDILEDMIGRICASNMLLTHTEGYTHDWVVLLPGLEKASNSTKQSSTNQTPFGLEQGYIPNAPRDVHNNKLGKLDINPVSPNIPHIQAMAREHAEYCIKQALPYEKL